MTAQAGSLFVVSTPIGNLGDTTLRAIETLRACDRILAEDTRRSRRLLSHFGIAGKVVGRLDAHASERDLQQAVASLQGGARIALLTDAGTPGVSDPGAALIRAAIAADVPIVPIPGASAVLAAFVASGLAGDGGFRFMGFLPREGAARREALAAVAATPEPVVLFESANRLRATLQEIADATPDRLVCVARELTKVHEELVRGRCAELAADAREWVGEIALVLGAHSPADRLARADDVALDARIDEALARGDHARSAAERLAAWSGRSRREVYERLLTRRRR
ncbi:MAG TPA: 16S rRNA (cytidine(1402)-2'-O)-methyltransferase [Polyangiaceae bacterium]|nr:16S rRNA (cytidine(1402)-2'-O)-methyltransferase [Polyangiaceae bacterium]